MPTRIYQQSRNDYRAARFNTASENDIMNNSTFYDQKFFPKTKEPFQIWDI